MKHFQKSVLIILVIFILSCQDDQNKKLNGNWASYLNDAGYTEFYFRDSTLQVFAHWLGNSGKWKYTLEKDSIIYDYGYRGQLILLNDSIFVLSGNHLIDTFYKLPDSITIYNRETMSRRLENGEEIFMHFYDQFYERMSLYELQHNIDLGEPIDTNEIYTEEIPIN